MIKYKLYTGNPHELEGKKCGYYKGDNGYVPCMIVRYSERTHEYQVKSAQGFWNCVEKIYLKVDTNSTGIKRYVKEFANDIIQTAQEIENDTIRLTTIAEVNKVVKLCERGYITNFEAMQQIVRYAR